MYKDANYDSEMFNKKYPILIGHVFIQCTVNETSSLFTNIFIEFAKWCIPSKAIVVREDDEPRYDSE